MITGTKRIKLSIQLAGFAMLIATMMILATQIAANADAQRQTAQIDTVGVDTEHNILCYRACSFTR